MDGWMRIGARFDVSFCHHITALTTAALRCLILAYTLHVHDFLTLLKHERPYKTFTLSQLQASEQPNKTKKSLLSHFLWACVRSTNIIRWMGMLKIFDERVEQRNVLVQVCIMKSYVYVATCTQQVLQK